MKCQQCGNPLDDDARADAVYCSDSCRQAAWRQARHADAVMVSEVIDAHSRATRLYANAKKTRDDMINLVLSSTFSGAMKPNDHRIAYQVTLERESIQKLRDVLSAVLDEAQ